MADIRGIELASEIYSLEDTSARSTATTASQTATQASQTATTASQTATQASQTATTASQTATQVDSKIGNLANLKTVVKTSIVEAVNELLTPATLPIETISLETEVSATAAVLRERIGVGKIQSGLIFFTNLAATEIGGTASIVIGTCSLRPLSAQSFIGSDYVNNAVIRITIRPNGEIVASESKGVVSGNNQIRIPYIIIA